jgi:hypothetical protein
MGGVDESPQEWMQLFPVYRLFFTMDLIDFNRGAGLTFPVSRYRGLEEVDHREPTRRDAGVLGGGPTAKLSVKESQYLPSAPHALRDGLDAPANDIASSP